jgi:hypothetical protein
MENIVSAGLQVLVPHLPESHLIRRGILLRPEDPGADDDRTTAVRVTPTPTRTAAMATGELCSASVPASQNERAGLGGWAPS